MLPLLAALFLPAADIPKGIAVPTGHRVLFTLYAKGVQMYEAVKGKGGRPEWSAASVPLADLFDEKGKLAGRHCAGPSWEALDGTLLQRDASAVVKSAPAPDPKNDIPWLLLKVKAGEGRAGAFSPVIYIQRINTQGGKAPSDPPLRFGTRIGVPYRAVYLLHAPKRDE
jgi:hypothetical protein